MDNLQHVWNVYQAESDLEQLNINKCYWRYERFDGTGKVSEQLGDFTVSPPIPVEVFSTYTPEDIGQLISANVDKAGIEA